MLEPAEKANRDCSRQTEWNGCIKNSTAVRRRGGGADFEAKESLACSVVSFNRLPKLITTDFYLQSISEVSNFIFNEKTLEKNFEEVKNLIFFFNRL